MSVGNNIRRLRKKAGLTQDELAQRLGVSRSTITQWEGEWSMPRTRRLRSIAEVLHVSYADIVFDSEAQNTKYDGSTIPLLKIEDVERLVVPYDLQADDNSFKSPNAVDNDTNLNTDEATSETPIDIEFQTLPNVEIPSSVFRQHSNAIALVMNNDSMSRIAPKGMVVVFDPSLMPSNGQVAILSTSEYGMQIRRWYCGSSNLMLVAEGHDTYDDIVIPRESDVRVYGTVVWVQSFHKLDQ